MQPLLRAAVVAAALSALVRAAAGSAKPAGAKPTARPSRTAGEQLPSVCPPGTLPDNGVCIPVPNSQLGGAALQAEKNGHHERSGRWRIYDQIPRRPDRPANYRRYRYPVPPEPGQSLVMSGYDLDLPDYEQRRGPGLKAVGHGGIDLAEPRGTRVRLVDLEHQVGNAEVLYVGPLFGNTVVTRHTVREGGHLREYLVLYGHLQGPAPGLHKGMTLEQGSLIGFVGDSGSPGVVHLHLEVRRVRQGENPADYTPREIVENAHTVVCDPRNVLPLRKQ